MHLTRSAVSHQLRLLERDLGFDLLERIGKGVALTARGRRYAHDVHKVLAMLGDAGAKYRDGGIGGSFRICSVPGFASLWLCNHIAEFQEIYPDVSLSIRTPPGLDDVSNPDVDAFITFGDGNWPNHGVEILCHVHATPLCSPSLLNRFGGFSKPSDVLRTNLLHLYDFDEWARWLSLTKVENANPTGGILFYDMNLVFAAAIAGQGIAMGDELTGQKALSEGTLVRPFDINFRASRSYYLVVDLAKSDHPVLPAFRDWLRSSLADTAAEIQAARG